MEFQPGNIELLIDGKEAFPRIIQRIRSAKRSIYINMFIWRDDEIGNKIAKELLDAANRSVKIFISKDAFGAISEKAEENKQSFFHKEKRLSLWALQKWIDFFYYTPGEAKTSKQMPNVLADLVVNNKNVMVEKTNVKRDHSKYYIFDDEILILGGMNIDNREADRDVDGTPWNSYMCEIKGKKVVDRFKARISGEADFDPDLVFDFVVNTKKCQRLEIKSKLIELLSMAKNKVYIEMAYFGDKEITAKIIETAKRGVKITIVLPKKANLFADLNLKIMKEILCKAQNNVTVYLCKNMIHSKTVNIDERFTLLGSANFNFSGRNEFDEVDVFADGQNLSCKKKLIQNIKKHMDISIGITDPSFIKFNRFRAFLEGLAIR